MVSVFSVTALVSSLISYCPLPSSSNPHLSGYSCPTSFSERFCHYAYYPWQYARSNTAQQPGTTPLRPPTPGSTHGFYAPHTEPQHRAQDRGKGKGKNLEKGKGKGKKGHGKGKGKDKGKEGKNTSPAASRSSTPPPAVFAPPARGKAPGPACHYGSHSLLFPHSHAPAFLSSHLVSPHLLPPSSCHPARAGRHGRSKVILLTLAKTDPQVIFWPSCTSRSSSCTGLSGCASPSGTILPWWTMSPGGASLQHPSWSLWFVTTSLTSASTWTRTLERILRGLWVASRSRFTSRPRFFHQDQWWLSCACALHLLAPATLFTRMTTSSCFSCLYFTHSPSYYYPILLPSHLVTSIHSMTPRIMPTIYIQPRHLVSGIYPITPRRCMFLSAYISLLSPQSNL